MRRHVHWITLLAGAAVAFFLLTWLSQLAASGVTRQTPNVGPVLLAMALFCAAIVVPIVLIIRAIVQLSRTHRRAQRAKGRFTDREQRILARGRHAAGAWEHARGVRRDLLAQRVPGAMDQWDVVPVPGERFFARLVLTHARYYGRDVGYHQTSAFAFGRPAFVLGVLAVTAISNAAARSRAAAQSAPQWREWQTSTVYVTNKRLAVHAGGRWLSFDYAAMNAVYPEVAAGTLVCQFDQAEPLLLAGPEAPIAAIFTVLQTYGIEALRRHPSLQPLDHPASPPSLPPVGHPTRAAAS